MARVLLGMSGGVDSSVAAYLLKEEGYEVVGVTMSLFNQSEEAREKQIGDAKRVCEKLGIEHHVVDYQNEFNNNIIKDFIDNYLNGKTPNPCVLCNKKFKFGALWEKAKELNCEYIATGHYANVIDGNIHRMDSSKDQSYFLYQISKEVVPHILFPLNKFSNKEEIRQIATRENLVEVADKKDSQDICFIEEGNYTKFLEENLNTLPDKGDFILTNGEIIGKHKGIIYYTIGQRKGLGISYQTPLYVVNIDKTNNQVILGTEEDLYKKIVYIENINLHVTNLPNNLQAKTRFRSDFYPCKIELIDDNNIKVIFDNPVKSPTPGQSLVLYSDTMLVGGGIIKRAE
jgi:tRNA-specific 2-thiouridylase